MNILKQLPFVEDINLQSGSAYLVGGYVRDLLMSRQSKDVDILVIGIPIDRLIIILEQHGKVDQVGKSFGVLKMKYKEWNLDIALPRTEVKTGVGHTGFEIVSDHNISLERDLERRDFTMNAIAMDSNGHYIDPFGGIQDIIAGKIKAVSINTFSDDPLRILRAYQFSSRFKFKFDPLTLKKMYNNRYSLSEISGERIHGELEKLVKGEDVARVFKHMIDYSILETLLSPEQFTYFHEVDTNKLNSVAKFVFVASGFKLNQAIIEKLHLTNDEKKELEVLDSVYKDPSRENIYYQLKKWKSLLQTMFFMNTLAGKNIHAFNMKHFPKNQEELDITSERLMEAGYTGKALGDAYKKIVKAIMSKELENYDDEILDFLEK